MRMSTDRKIYTDKFTVRFVVCVDATETFDFPSSVSGDSVVFLSHYGYFPVDGVPWSAVAVPSLAASAVVSAAVLPFLEASMASLRLPG